MESELERLASFVDLPPSASSTCNCSRLSRSGFYYGGHDDAVVCFQCRREFSDWRSFDGLMEQHGPTNCRIEEPYNRPTIAAEEPTLESDAASNETSSRNQAFTELASRIESYLGHPFGVGLTAERLAEAGLYYVGPEDKVRCFRCSGELTDWRPTDDPWTKHARRFPRCPFVRALASDDVTVAAPREMSPHGVQSEDARFAVDPRDVEEQMKSEICQAVIRMGFDVGIVRSVIGGHLGTGYDFRRSEDLLQAVLRLQDEHPDLCSGRQQQQQPPADDFEDIDQNIPANTPLASHDTDDGTTDNLSEGIMPLREDVGPAEHKILKELPVVPIVFMPDPNGVELVSLRHDDSSPDEGYATVSSSSGSE